MAYHIDLTDIEPVNADVLLETLYSLDGSALIDALPRPVAEEQMESISAAFWRRHQVAGRQELAVFYRLTALLDLLPARPLAPLFERNSRSTLTAAVRLAAVARLNPKWGFNRAKFISMLKVDLDDAVGIARSVEPERSVGELTLAA